LTLSLYAPGCIDGDGLGSANAGIDQNRSSLTGGAAMNVETDNVVCRR
jgi:hypothetical protein